MTGYIDNFNTKKKYKKTYIDKVKFHEALVDWKQKKEIDPDYRMTEFIGECILKLVNHAATRRNFSGYTYLDQMKTEALYLCIRYAHNYNPAFANCDPFNYFSKTIERAFKFVINKEKTLAETKFNYIKKEFCNHPEYDFRVIDEEEHS